MKQFSVARVVIKIQRGCSVGGFVQLGGYPFYHRKARGTRHLAD